MVTEEDVRRAYQYFLAREPESKSVIDFHLQASNIQELCNSFLTSDEFVAKQHARLPKALDLAGPLDIEVDVSGGDLEQMLKLVEREWTELGQKDPYWSVWTADKFRTETFSTHASEFYNSGQSDVDRLKAWLKRNRIALTEIRTCCEYGCGTGRVTLWLARLFPDIIACDISQSHLNVAEKALCERGVRNVTYTCVSSRAAIHAVPRFDALFSTVVLQHNPPPIMAFLLRTLLRRLTPGGVAFFQIPTYAIGYRFSAAKWLAAPPKGMEMNVLPKLAVFSIARES
jgi:hypothetical protein